MSTNKEYFDNAITNKDILIYIKSSKKYYVFRKLDSSFSLTREVKESKSNFITLELEDHDYHDPIKTYVNDISKAFDLTEIKKNTKFYFSDKNSVFYLKEIKNTKPKEMKTYNSYLYYLKKEERLKNLWEL